MKRQDNRSRCHASAIDRRTNADYGARFLASLYRRPGNWSSAVGHYHFAAPEEHARYVAAVQTAMGHPEAPAPEGAGVIDV